MLRFTRGGEMVVHLRAKIFAYCFATSLLLPCYGAAETGAPTLSVVKEHTHTREVRDIAVMQETVWVATSGGIAVHRREDGRFLFKLTSRDGLPGNSVHALLPLDGNHLAAGGAFGAAIVDISDDRGAVKVARILGHNTDRFNPTFALIDTDAGAMRLDFQTGLAPLENQEGIRAQLGAGTGGMWRSGAWNAVALATGGLDGRLVIRFHDTSRKPDLFHLDGPVQAIAPFQDSFLIATGGSLYRYEKGGVRPLLLREADGEKNVAATALAPHRGEVYVGTASGHLLRCGDQGVTRAGAVTGRITALAVEGRYVWLGVASRGLVRFDTVTRTVSESFRPGGEICSNHITTLTRHRGVLVAGSFDEGICRFENGKWRPLPGQSSPYVLGVASDGENLWVGTSSGLLRYDAAFKPLPIDASLPKALTWFADTAVTAATEADDDRVVLGSPWGVVVLKRTDAGFEVRFVEKRQGLPPHLTQVAALGDTLFFSSERDGVRALSPERKSLRTYLDPTYLPEAWVLDVAPVGPNRFWAATCQHGVVFVTDQKSVRTDRAAGLHDNRTIAVAPFGDGAFVTTLGGLSYVNTEGRVFSPVEPYVADIRGAALYVDETTLWHGTESGLVQFSIASRRQASVERPNDRHED